MTADKRRYVWLSVAGAAILIVGLVAYMLHTPPVPQEWVAVRRGMTHAEVLRLIPDKEVDAREKGFYLFSRRYRQILRPCWWQLHVSYDEDERVSEAWLLFTDPYCGKLSETREHIKRLVNP